MPWPGRGDNRRKWLRRPGVLLAIALLATACGPAAAPPAAKPAAAPPPAAAAPPAVAPGAAPAAPDWQAQWQQIVAAARQEGKVVVNGPAAGSYRPPLTEAFEQDYPDIKVEYTNVPGLQFWPRIYREREGGQYLWDVVVYGVEVNVFRARDDGVVDPVRPVLLLPEVLDDSKWLQGLDMLFADKERQYFPAFFASAQGGVFVNRDVLPESELQSQAQLLDPKLKGKIVLTDPSAGPGLGQLTVLYAAYGEDFVTRLLTEQEVVPSTDYRQIVEWIVRGRYPIAIGVDQAILRDFQKEGAGLNVKPLDGPIPQTSGGGALILPNKAPHPNAARVYANWLLTQKAQGLLATATGYNSRRLDVPPVDPEGVVDPAKMDRYIAHQAEEILPKRQRAQELGQQLLRR